MEENQKRWNDERETPDFKPAGKIDEGDAPEPKHVEPEPMMPVVPVE